MPNRHTPGCRCCGPNCTAYIDRFDRADSTTVGGDWIEDAGDWEIVSGELTTSDSDAEIRTTGGVLGTDFYLRFKASDGDEINLYDSASGGSRNWVVLTVGAAGKIESFSDTFGGLYHGCDIAIPADEWVTLRIRCGVFFSVNGVEVFRSALYGFTPIVLGTGTIAAPVYFDDYEQRYTYDPFFPGDHVGCPTCGGDCKWFPGGVVVPVTFEISGATDRWNGTFWEYYSRLNGTYEAAELNTPNDCYVKISGLSIDVVEEAGSEVNIESMWLDISVQASGFPRLQLIKDDSFGYFSYEKYTPDTDDLCSGSTFTLINNSVSYTEVGVAIITVP